MKTLIVIIPAALALTLGGCSSGSSSDGASSGGGSKLASCDTLVGKPVGSATGDKLDKFAGCDAGEGATYEEPGSFGCYPNDSETGEQDGFGFFVGGEVAFFFGKPGGSWMKGPTSLSITDMADKIGC